MGGRFVQSEDCKVRRHHIPDIVKIPLHAMSRFLTVVSADLTPFAFPAVSDRLRPPVRR
jgi:hypothetical protein